MARIPVPELSRYLLRGQSHHPACLRLPTSVGIDGRRSLVSSAVRHAETPPSADPTSTLERREVPRIKQLRSEAKARKAAGRKNNSELQTVPGWELTVGIEIHAQLNTRHKLFSTAAPPLPSDEPNTHTALFDLAIPGSQPIFQPATLIPAVRAALALNCEIQRVSRWDRKHYFWWDQPSGYQITQYYEPFAKEGYLTLFPRDGIASEDGESVTVGIRQIQMEQDTGKTLAGPNGLQWVDFNRVGVPLIEIITKPEIHHPRTAAAFMRKIQAYLSAVDACIGGMEAGGLRADVNVSVRRTDHPLGSSQPLGQRTEIKNLSSFKAVEDAIIAERDRQIALLEQGGVVLGETRGWSIGSTETKHLRGKEGEVDYRYMPDPDLPPLTIEEEVVCWLEQDRPMLPDDEVLYLRHLGLKDKDIEALMQSEKGSRLEYFYNVLKCLRYRSKTRLLEDDRAVLAGNWVLHELGRLTSERNASADGSVEELDITSAGESSRVPASQFAEIIHFLYEKKISKQVAKELLFSVFRGDLSGNSPHGYSSVEEAIEQEDLWLHQLSESEHEKMAAEVLAEEEETLEKKFGPHFSQQKSYPEGQLMRLVGKMMKIEPVGQVDPQLAALVLRRAIEARFKATGA